MIRDNHLSARLITQTLKHQPGSIGSVNPLPVWLATPEVCLAMNITVHAVGSYPTISPLPERLGGAFALPYPAGGLFSVALSLISRSPVITWQVD